MTTFRTSKAQIAGVLFAIFMSGSASAETLTDALVSAYNNSNLLEQSRAVLRASDEDVASAVSALRPTLNYNMERNWAFNQDNSFFLDRDSVVDTLELTSQLTLYEFGYNRLAVEAAKEAVLASREALVQQEQSVLYAAVSSYMTVISTLEIVDLRENNVRVLEEEVRATRDRFEVGEVTRTDVAQAESRLATSQSNLESARGDLQSAREAYKLDVGHYPGKLAPPPPLPKTAASLEDARAIAVRGHPNIKQAQRLVNVAEINVNRAQVAVLPTLSATARAGYDNGSSHSSSGNLEGNAQIGIAFGGPIYRGGALNSAFRASQAQRDQNRAQLLQTTAEVSERVGQAWAVREVAAAVLVSTRRAIDAAQIAFDGTREEASLGARTTLDVLDAEQELLDARNQRISAATDEQIAVYALLVTMGRLTVDSLGLPVTAYDPTVYYNAVKGAPPITSKQGLKLDKVLKSIGKY